MSNCDNWHERPDIASALAHLDAHYAMLDCRTPGARRDRFLNDIRRFQTPIAESKLRAGLVSCGTRRRSADDIQNLAFGTWLTFLEPVQGLAEALDEYRFTDDGVGWPGAFGRQWARRASDVAWTIYMASCEPT